MNNKADNMRYDARLAIAKSITYRVDVIFNKKLLGSYFLKIKFQKNEKNHFIIYCFDWYSSHRKL